MPMKVKEMNRAFCARVENPACNVAPSTLPPT